MKSISTYALSLFFTCSLISFSQVSFAGRCDTIKYGQAAFFKHSNYKGACVVRDIGPYANSKAMGIGNDKISSIKIAPGMQVSLCKNSNFKGGCKTYTTNMASLGKMNDKTSSAIIAKVTSTKTTPAACKPTANQVAFFSDANYKGYCVVRRKIGPYTNAKAMGIGNDKISSIKVGSRMQVKLCKDSNFRGGCKIYKTSMASLGRMNDKTSSAIIEKKTSTVPTSAACDPRVNQATFFEHANYKGACVVRNIGRYANAKAIGIGNDKISSIKVGPRTQVSLCNNSNFRACNTYIKNQASLGRNNDKTSSAVIKKLASTPSTSAACDPSAHQITFFQHANYKGACVVRKVGRYANAKAIGIGNDIISSIKVGPGVRVKLCNDTNFRACNTYIENQASLGRKNDKTSSAIIEKISSKENALIDCKANDNQIAIFRDPDFRGDCAVLGLGKYGAGYYDESKLLKIGNDKLSSIQVGKNVRALVCEHSFRGDTSTKAQIMYYTELTGRLTYAMARSKYRNNPDAFEEFMDRADPKEFGKCQYLYSNQNTDGSFNIKNMASTRIGDNKASAIFVYKYDFKTEKNKFSKNSPCYPGDNSTRIAIFEHNDFQGECKVLNMAEYSDSGQFGRQFADKISSIMLGKNSKVYVEVYSDANYNNYRDSSGERYTGGLSDRFYQSVTNVGYNNIGNDSISSIKIKTCIDSTHWKCKERYKAVIPDKQVPFPSENQQLSKPKITVERR